jgi:uncharacterized membrane protein HdeD (DUF308 family)
MTTIDDYLAPLKQGIWEVTILKSEVINGPGVEWEKSLINIPSPGVVASYRKGQYHLHETKTHWKIHLDRFDPKVHPILHLIDDAPLFLMIAETFITIFSFTKDTLQYGPDHRIFSQTATWHQLILFGMVSIIIGAGFALSPDIAFAEITDILIPAGVFILGLFSVLNGFFSSDKTEKKSGVMQGICLCIVSGVFFYIPQLFWSVFILILLGLWMFSSAGLILFRVFHGKTAGPEGFYSRSIIGVISLIFGLLIFIIPIGVIRIFLIMLGLIIIAFGLSGIIAGLRLRSKMIGYNSAHDLN